MPESGAGETIPQARDQGLQVDWPARAPPQNSGGEEVRLSQESAPSLRPKKRESTNYVNKSGVFERVPPKIAAQESHENMPQKPARSNTSQIILAKISPLRYIAFKFLIRYVDGRVALTTP